MAHSVRTDKRGFTFIELLFALSITLISMLAVYTLTEIAMTNNLRTAIRDEGVKVAEEVMNTLRSLPFDSITPDGAWNDTRIKNVLGYSSVSKDFRNLSVTYTIGITVTYYPLTSPYAKEINLTVTWPYRGTNYQHNIRTIMRE